jgi:diguanylate cyclase (GGDEF)-like protein/PAS domain S-box-containing protein
MRTWYAKLNQKFFPGFSIKLPPANVWWQFLPIGIATLIMLFLLQLGICQALENLAYDALFRLRGAIPWDSQVVVVEIDEASLREAGYLSWSSRQNYAALVDQLATADPAVIVLDIPLSEPSFGDDDPLVAAIARQGRTILTESWDQYGKHLLTNPTLKAAAIATGHTYKQEDLDGRIRFINPQRQGVLALGIVAVQQYAAFLHRNIPLPNLDRPLWINWLGPTHQASRYSFAAVMQGHVPANILHHKIILVGITTATFDTIQTPFDRRPPSSSVYLHAAVISNILQHNFLYRPNWIGLGFLLLLAGSSLIQLIQRLRFTCRLSIWIGLSLAWGILSAILFVQTASWLPVASPMMWFGLIGGVAAIAELLRIHVLLRQSEERYALAVRGANEGLWDWDLRTDRIYLSPRWKEMLGYTEQDLSDCPQEWLSRIHPLDIDRLKLAIADYLAGKTNHFEHEHRLLHRDNTYHWMLSRGLAVRDREGKATRMVGSQIDITLRKQAEEELRHDAFYDRLTGLPNRAGLIDQLQQAIAHNQTHSMAAFAVLWLDLDQFKVVNNSLGSALGDRLLVAIAQRLRSFLADDVVARLGGDEFAILLNQVQEAQEATRLAERVQQVLALPFYLDGHEVYITASIGIVLSSIRYTQPEHLLRDADTAMHRAKALGRARYQVFDKTMRTRMVVKLRLENDLRRAIARGERLANSTGIVSTEAPFLTPTDQIVDAPAYPEELPELQLYYQPIVHLATRQVAGFEALVRWNHPQEGLLPPTKFIATAEETGLIVPLGWWIFRAACYQMRQWRQEFPEQTFLTMNVNLSSQQFAMAGLTERIRQILQETDLEPANLTLEMTESMVMENAASVIDVLHQIRSLGIQLAIDDFGTGYSSLSYLPRFPITTLKIDRSFVSRIDDDIDNLEIVRTILVLAHNLGMDVTAEGVETAEQVAQLIDMGCEYGQGYFFSRALDAQAATQLLQQQRGKLEKVEGKG